MDSLILQRIQRWWSTCDSSVQRDSLLWPISSFWIINRFSSCSFSSAFSTSLHPTPTGTAVKRKNKKQTPLSPSEQPLCKWIPVRIVLALALLFPGLSKSWPSPRSRGHLASRDTFPIPSNLPINLRQRKLARSDRHRGVWEDIINAAAPNGR